MTSSLDLEARAAAFRALHDGPGVLVLPNVWDALSAHVVASAGAPAIATGSAPLAWARGTADGEVMSLDTLLSVVREITSTVSLPVTVDLETGWSDDPAAVVSAVRRIAEAGAVGVNLEDGAKSPELLVRKIAACKAHTATAHVFINARTDLFLRGLGPEDGRLEEAVRRLRQFEDAGADGLFVPKLLDASAIREVTSRTSRPLNLLAFPGIPGISELSAAGVRRLSVGPKLAFVAMTAAKRACLELLREGTYERLFDAEFDFAGVDGAFRRRTP